jgi:phosphoserine phosphatase RsbU/P
MLRTARSKGGFAMLFERGAVLGLLYLVCLSAPSWSRVEAQIFSVQSNREPIISLDGEWRFHTGDDAAWVKPGYDDSAWPRIRAGRSWTEQGYPGYGGFAWYRFALESEDGSKPMGLLLAPIWTGYQVFVDGRLIGTEGSAAPTLDPLLAREAYFAIPAGRAGPRTIEIAIRVWSYAPFSTWYGAGAAQTGSEAGDPESLQGQLESDHTQAAAGFVNYYTYCSLVILVGITVFILFLLRREDREYLWFAGMMLGAAANAALHFMIGVGIIPTELFGILDIAAGALSTVAALAFFSIILRTRRSWAWRAVCIAAALTPLPTVLLYLRFVSLAFTNAMLLILLFPAYAWILITVARCAIRNDQSARLLLLPSTLIYGWEVVTILFNLTWQLGLQRKLQSPEFPLLRHPFVVHPADVIHYLFVLALLVYLVSRFSLARQEEARLATEMSAARNMQQLLLPAIRPSTPGFVVESAYLAASEVGGDFYHVLPGENGGLWIVVGDVSGKGLKAAMIVSTIMGALRGSSLQRPAEALTLLNRVLHGQIDGFVTCCAASIDADGHLSIANAGHLSPYRNGEELMLAPDLPLGLTTLSDYQEQSIQLVPGDQLTFVSDGIVEAMDKNQNLFGFERTREISIRPAQTIAETARDFGQADDITVVKVTMGPKAVAAR